MEMYDRATDTWTAKADLNTARRFTALEMIDGALHAIGGGSVKSVERYDAGVDSWSIVPEMDIPAGVFVKWSCSVRMMDGRE